MRTQLIFIKDLSKINSFAENFIVTFSFLPNFAPDLSNDLRFFIDQRSKFNTLKGKKKIMKKIMMTLAAMAVAATMNAQVYVGGSLGFASESYDGNSETVWSIMPEIGYNLNEDWAVGVVAGYGESRDKVKGLGTDKVKTVAVSPYVRYTPVKFEKVNIFVDGGFGYQNVNWGGDVKENIWEFGLKPGVAVNLNDKLSFVSHFGFLGYKYDKYKGADKGTNTFGFNLGSEVSFGMYYNF